MTRGFILFVFSIQLCIANAQFDIFQDGVRIYNTNTGWDISGSRIENNQRYSFTKDTCISGFTFLIVSIENYYRGNWYNNPKRLLFYDTTQKKIYQNGTLLYDFNIKIDSTTKWGFTLDSTKWLTLNNKARKFLFFTDRNSPYVSKRNDIWIDGFGSIVLDYLNPVHPNQIDGYHITYNPLVNFGNNYKLIKTENASPNLQFKPIIKLIEKELPRYYISYKCSGSNDTFWFYDKCYDDSLYAYSMKLHTDTLKKHDCGDTIFFKYTIEGKTSNKSVFWTKGSPYSIVGYPPKHGQQVTYTGEIKIMNTDSSCEAIFQFDTIRANCKYCDNPNNKPELSLQIKKDSLCKDTLEYSVLSYGIPDSLWAYHSPPINYALNGLYPITLYYGNRICVIDSLKKKIHVGCQPADIAGVSEPQIRLYPNPCSDFVYIAMPQNTLNQRISFSITNILGQPVYLIAVITQDGYILDVRTLPEGFYFIEMKDSNNNVIKTERILISR
jgi:hypothetical protein